MGLSAETVVVCRCEQVSQQEIESAIEDGAATCAGVKRRTRAGMGDCQGRTCHRLVANIVAEQTGQSLEAVCDLNSRIPVRPVSIETWGGAADDSCHD